MNCKDVTAHERTVTATFTEREIRDILTKKLAADNDFKIDPRKTMIKMRFRRSYKGSSGTSGFVNFIDVTMRNDLTKQTTED